MLKMAAVTPRKKTRNQKRSPKTAFSSLWKFNNKQFCPTLITEASKSCFLIALIHAKAKCMNVHRICHCGRHRTAQVTQHRAIISSVMAEPPIDTILSQSYPLTS